MQDVKGKFEHCNYGNFLKGENNTVVFGEVRMCLKGQADWKRPLPEQDVLSPRLCEMGGCCETKDRGRAEEMCHGAVVTGNC